jgi:RNA recognition motif-containing protein
MVVFLKNIDFKVTEDDIRKFFEGKTISKISLPKNDKGKPKGFGYV